MKIDYRFLYEEMTDLECLKGFRAFELFINKKVIGRVDEYENGISIISGIASRLENSYIMEDINIIVTDLNERLEKNPKLRSELCPKS